MGEGRERERRHSRSQSIRRSASSSGVGRSPSLSLSLSTSIYPSPSSPLLPLPVLSVLSARPPIIIIFYHNICFSHILFYVNGRCLPPPTRSPVLAPFSRWFPLRMHGLGELLAFCLEFKKFFRRSRPRAPSSSPAPPSHPRFPTFAHLRSTFSFPRPSSTSFPRISRTIRLRNRGERVSR